MLLSSMLDEYSNDGRRILQSPKENTALCGSGLSFSSSPTRTISITLWFYNGFLAVDDVNTWLKLLQQQLVFRLSCVNNELPRHAINPYTAIIPVGKRYPIHTRRLILKYDRQIPRT